MSERKLATIRRISNLVPIDGADRIELAIVDGWKVIVKKEEYKVGELVVYLEIDSWVPNTIAPFLTKSGHYPKVYQGVEGQRLKTVKMKGVYSQGLILPLGLATTTFIDSKFDEGQEWSEFFYEGADVTELLGILKWEKEIPANMQGVMKGSFPTAIPKTNQERIQNLAKKLKEFADHTWEVTEKLHGCSATYYLDSDGEFHVCSRNVNLKFDSENVYWQMAVKYNIRRHLEIMQDAEYEDMGVRTGYAIQGEIIGPGINGNQYELDDPDFYVFDLYNTMEGYCPASMRQELVSLMHMKHVPVIYNQSNITDLMDVEYLLKMSEGTSMLNESTREGLVFKSEQNPDVSFKVVSNLWLLGGGEDQ